MYLNLVAQMHRKKMTVLELSRKTGIKYCTLRGKMGRADSFTLGECLQIRNAVEWSDQIEKLFEFER